MKVRVDMTKCAGYGRCEEVCPSMFEIDEFGFVKLLQNGIVPAEDEQRALDAVEQCPEKAIIVEDANATA